MSAIIKSCWNLLLVLLLLFAGEQHLTSAMRACDEPVDHFRLYTRVLPLHYKVELQLSYFTSGKPFRGKVDIQLNFQRLNESFDSVTRRTISGRIHPFALDPNKIMLNIDYLFVSNVEFKQYGSRASVIDYCHDAVNKILVITLSALPSRSNRSRLTLEFEGQVQTESKGLFTASVHPSKAILLTNLKTNYARRLFPCFDDPEFKATFHLIITHPKETIALSNTIGKARTQGDWRVTTFQRTPLMSSYLLSLAVGKFNAIHDTSSNRIPISIYTPQSMLKDTSQMLLKAVEAYDKVSDFFVGLPQPLEKIDIVVVNMEPIVVEGWGLITMSSDLLLLCDHQWKSKPNDWSRAFTALMTQMIHQRLANLVTMRWWNDLWLKEGLATYLASELCPEIGGELYSLVHTTFSAMNGNDDQSNVISISPAPFMDLIRAEELEAWYYLVTYKKPAMIVRMFARFFGKDKFKLAIHHLILSNAQMGLVDADDWWVELSRQDTEYSEMKEVARQWTDNVGYPTIDVYLNIEGNLVVRQLPDQAMGQVWSVPIQYKFHAGSVTIGGKFLLFHDYTLPMPESFNIMDENHWFTLNPGYTGCYHVRYSNHPILQAQSQAILSRRMATADRLQMLSNTYFYVKQTGYTDVFERLLVVFYQSQETNDGVILLLTKMLTELHNNDILQLSPLDAVTNLMKNYHAENGYLSLDYSSNLLKQCARGQIVDYLANKLSHLPVISSLQEFTSVSSLAPPFIQEAVENLSRRV